MRIHYYKSTEPNFGDDLNGWIWQRLVPQRLGSDDDTVMIGIGTIISRRELQANKKIIFSSGAGYNPVPLDLREPEWRVVAVRGPLTAELMQLPKEAAVTDGGVLTSLFPEFQTPIDDRHGKVFMPHLSAARAVDWRPICVAAGLDYLDPRDDQFKLLKRIGSAQLVLADAMHAAVIADSLRVPWLPVSTSVEINTFKWVDWTRSLGLPYEPMELLPMSPLQLMQGIVLRATMQHHRVRSSDPAVVLAAHREFLRRKLIWEAGPSRHVGFGFLKIYLALVGRRTLMKPRLNIKENIRRLKNLADCRGVMSEDEIFTARRDELLRRLQSLS